LAFLAFVGTRVAFFRDDGDVCFVQEEADITSDLGLSSRQAARSLFTIQRVGFGC
jgi:hypothetical protein